MSVREFTFMWNFPRIFRFKRGGVELEGFSVKARFFFSGKGLIRVKGFWSVTVILHIWSGWSDTLSSMLLLSRWRVALLSRWRVIVASSRAIVQTDGQKSVMKSVCYTIDKKSIHRILCIRVFFSWRKFMIVAGNGFSVGGRIWGGREMCREKYACSEPFEASHKNRLIVYRLFLLALLCDVKV